MENIYTIYIHNYKQNSTKFPPNTVTLSFFKISVAPICSYIIDYAIRSLNMFPRCSKWQTWIPAIDIRIWWPLQESGLAPQINKGDPRSHISPRVMALSAMGLKLGFRVFADHARKYTSKTNASTIFTCCAAFYACFSFKLRPPAQTAVNAGDICTWRTVVTLITRKIGSPSIWGSCQDKNGADSGISLVYLWPAQSAVWTLEGQLHEWQPISCLNGGMTALTMTCSCCEPIAWRPRPHFRQPKHRFTVSNQPYKKALLSMVWLNWVYLEFQDMYLGSF